MPCLSRTLLTRLTFVHNIPRYQVITSWTWTDVGPLHGTHRPSVFDLPSRPQPTHWWETRSNWTRIWPTPSHVIGPSSSWYSSPIYLIRWKKWIVENHWRLTETQPSNHTWDTFCLPFKTLRVSYFQYHWPRKIISSNQGRSRRDSKNSGHNTVRNFWISWHAIRTSLATKTYQRHADNTFVGSEFVAFYIDDIQVMSQSHGEDIQHFKTVFDILVKNHLTNNTNEHTFDQEEVTHKLKAAGCTKITTELLIIK